MQGYSSVNFNLDRFWYQTGRQMILYQTVAGIPQVLSAAVDFFLNAI
jgi:hypothetical protein